MLSPDTLLQGGRYRILSSLGLGGMSAMYKAEAEHLKIKVALKELLVDVPHLREAFEQEAQRLARLRHVALPKVIDQFIENERQYFVMEYIEGQDLAELLVLRGKSFAVQEVLYWADLLLDVLDYLHQQVPPVIHRDIKPANLKLMPNGQIVLLDFGLATGGLASNGAEQNLSGYSLDYAPPEQLTDGAATAQSDLYALAATLYHLLTLQAPPDAQMRQQAIQRRKPDPLVPANRLNSDVPLHVAQLLTQALSLSPVDRPSNAAEMRYLLRLSAQQSAPSTDQAPSQPLVTVSKPSISNINRKWRLWVPIALAILLWIMIISGILAALMNAP